MNEILWHNRARKQMKRIPEHYREAVHESIDKLVEFPRCEQLDIIELKNHKYDYRLRVGRYRVLFDYSKIVKIIKIQEVKKRDERTY
ncbi:MAG: type II toxin-antitoxin system RelE/ParE family toxin [Deltaproteobacteria bacterium]